MGARGYDKKKILNKVVRSFFEIFSYHGVKNKVYTF